MPVPFLQLRKTEMIRIVWSLDNAGAWVPGIRCSGLKLCKCFNINEKYLSITYSSILPVVLHRRRRLSKLQSTLISLFSWLLIPVTGKQQQNNDPERYKREHLSSSIDKKLWEINTLCKLYSLHAKLQLFSSQSVNIRGEYLVDYDLQVLNKIHYL